MSRPLRITLALSLFLTACAPMGRIVRFKDPLTAQEHMQLGLLYERQAQYEAAEREYKSAVRQESENVPALIALGNAQFAQDKLKEAEKSFLRSLKLVPGHPGASNNLAMTYLKTGRKLRDAEALALRAQADQATRPYALDTLAGVYAKRGKFELARQALNEARKIAPPGDDAFLKHIDESERRVIEASEAASPNPAENRADGVNPS
jgi:Flp pilus assembly protein TadD